MEYRATARYMDRAYTSHIQGSDSAAVESLLQQLPPNINERNVVLIVESVYSGNVIDVVYVTTLSKYRVTTE